jgi:NADH-quinone oxidoreductase subunit M
LRFTVPLAPAAAQQWQWLLLGLGVAAILYGATAALAQTNLRRTLAYLSLSHVGLVVLGIATFSLHGVQGAVLQLLNFAVASGGLFLLLGFLHHRTGSTDMASLGGAAQTLPLLASGFLLFGLAGMGMPGTAGFPAELLLLLSAFQHHAGAGLAALAGMVLGTAAFLQIFRRVFFGPATRPAVLEAQDLVPRERWLMLVFALLLLAFGLWPALLLDMIGPAAQAWVARIG